MSVFDINSAYLETAYDVTGEMLADTYDISGERIGMDRAWKMWAVVSEIGEMPIGGTKQGACTDGTYIYQMAIGTNEYGDGHLIKYKISDGTYTVKHYTYTSQFYFGHANDITYNPNTGYLYVCTMESDGSVYVFDASDLSYVETIYLTNDSGDAYTVWQFCYDRIADCYYSAYRGDYLVYNSDWEYVRKIQMPTHPDATAQGCETDGEYIYRITYNPDYIDVAKTDGTYVTTINLSVSDEPESIMYDWDSNYYISTNSVYNNGYFYSVVLFD